MRSTCHEARDMTADVCDRSKPGERLTIHSDRGGRHGWPDLVAICEGAGLFAGCRRGADNSAKAGTGGVTCEDLAPMPDISLRNRDEARPKESLE